MGGFLATDYELLTAGDRAIVQIIAEQESRASQGTLTEAALADLSGEAVADLRPALAALVGLGYLRCDQDRFAIGNRYFFDWLRLTHVRADPPSRPVAAVPAPKRRGRAPGKKTLQARLNAQRSLLTQLEVARARDLLHVPSDVLAQIQQAEDETERLLQALTTR